MTSEARNRRAWFVEFLRDAFTTSPAFELRRVYDVDTMGKGATPDLFLTVQNERLTPAAGQTPDAPPQCEFFAVAVFRGRPGELDDIANDVVAEIETTLEAIHPDPKTFGTRTVAVLSVQAAEHRPAFFDEDDRGMVETRGLITYRTINV